MRNITTVLLAARQLKHLYDRLLAEAPGAGDFTRNELDVLLFLANHPGLDTARDISELRGLTKSHVCKSVESLVERGFLAGRQDRQDRRLVHLSLLPPAQPVVEAAQAAQGRFTEVLYRDVTDEERAVLERILEKIEKNVKEESDHGY